MREPLLRIAVVGHTNTGKTSLLRTLLRNEEFGEVSDRPATTRQVQAAQLRVGEDSWIELFDTPGLEDSVALLDHLDTTRSSSRDDVVAAIDQFLDSAAAAEGERFGQEAKALTQVRKCDAALYVIDARDRVLGRHKDELEILSRCARPVIPVLNFIASPEAQTAQWREHLARLGMHVIAEFDTVVLDGSSERLLLEKIRTVLDHHRDALTALLEERARQRRELERASADLIADLLIDAAAYAVPVPIADAHSTERAVEAFKTRLRRREQSCVDQLLALHRFKGDDVHAEQLPISQGKWELDLFSQAALKQFGVRAGGGAAAGALAGLSIDAMVGGISLGAATAIGAAIGALLGAGHARSRELINRARGRVEVRCDNSTLQLLALRQVSLVQALLKRGHAAVAPVKMQPQPAASFSRDAKKLFDEARLRPKWSAMAEPADLAAISSASRRSLQTLLTQELVEVIQRGPGSPV